MPNSVRNMGARPTRYSAENRWLSLVKQTIARFTRGNIAAQRERILLPDEQKRRHEEARKIAENWRHRSV